jgi:hypothetical protein
MGSYSPDYVLIPSDNFLPGPLKFPLVWGFKKGAVLLYSDLLNNLTFRFIPLLENPITINSLTFKRLKNLVTNSNRK